MGSLADNDGSVVRGDRCQYLRSFVAGAGAVWVAVILLYFFSSMISPAMLQVSHVLNMLQVAAFVGVIACGQTFALLIGGIDLSQAGTVTLINVVSTSLMMGSNDNIVPALSMCLLLALGIGISNAVLVIFLRVAPLIATLAMNSILFGAALVYTGAAPHGSAAPAFNWIGQGKVYGLPTSMLFWILIAAVLAWLTKATIYGRWIMAVGANLNAARMMGVPVRAVQASAYVLSALAATLGSLLLTAYVGTPSLGIGNQFLFSSVAAAVVGGVALTGGIGSIAAAVGGAIFITELASFTNMLRISTGTQMVLQGSIIALSVVFYRMIARRRRV